MIQRIHDWLTRLANKGGVSDTSSVEQTITYIRAQRQASEEAVAEIRRRGWLEDTLYPPPRYPREDRR